MTMVPLDPVSTAKIEEFLEMAEKATTFLLAPHNQQQAARVADYAAFFLQGELIEYAPGEELFFNPKKKETSDYIRGRYG
jgi:phosphate transport system ATP-binding protein